MPRNNTIYISGPISGTKDYIERFHAADKLLSSLGFRVVNPAKMNANMPKKTSYKTYIDLSIEMLKSCRQIYMLKGWEQSKGARAELALAECYNLIILYEE